MFLKDIAQRMNAELVDCDPETWIESVAPLDNAVKGDISFFTNVKYKDVANKTRASAIMVSKKDAGMLSGLPLMLVESAYLAMAEVSMFFMQDTRPAPGIAKNAYVANDAVIDESATVLPMAYVGSKAQIGSKTVICPGVVVEDNAIIGKDCLIYPNCSILRGCRIGNRVIIHSGSVIGSDGYGFTPDGSSYRKIPQTGIVQIDDDCEIGAGNTIDRATFGKTWIKRGVKIDNLVHIAHNVEVGEDTLLVAQVGISGSTKIGKHCIIAGKTGIVGHIEIGDDVIIGGRSSINKSLASGSIVSGTPAVPHRDALKVYATIPKLPEMRRQITQLTKQVQDLQKKLAEVSGGHK